MTIDKHIDTSDNPAPALTKDAIVSALTRQRDGLLANIGHQQDVRGKTNAVIAKCRAELADVERMLAATKPRTRKPKP